MKNIINFKRSHIVMLCAVVLATVSCSSSRKVSTSATFARANMQMYVTPVRADLKINPRKISYYMPVSEAISRGGKDNVIASAVKEALDANGGDVLLGIETILNYNEDGVIESIVVTGFPAYYINLRCDDSIPIVPEGNSKAKSDNAGGLFKIK